MGFSLLSCRTLLPLRPRYPWKGQRVYDLSFLGRCSRVFPRKFAYIPPLRHHFGNLYSVDFLLLRTSYQIIHLLYLLIKMHLVNLLFLYRYQNQQCFIISSYFVKNHQIRRTPNYQTWTTHNSWCSCPEFRSSSFTIHHWFAITQAHSRSWLFLLHQNHQS